jgi:hypothetical protein
MRFDLFGSVQAPRTAGGDPGRGFREYVETNVEADRLGFYSTFLVARFGESLAVILKAWISDKSHATQRTRAWRSPGRQVPMTA